MLLSEVSSSDTRIFIKSEWAPVSRVWPAVSFSRRAVGTQMRVSYDPARDLVVYVGTTNPANTPNPEHRSRLLSALRMDLRREFKTYELIPAESWARAQAEHGNRWLYAFAVTEGWNFLQLPSAREYIPEGYRRLGNPANLGNFVCLEANEAEAVRKLAVEVVKLELQSSTQVVQERARFLDAPRELKQEIFRMAQLIEQRRRNSGSVSMRTHPMREAAPPLETQEMLFRLWSRNHGTCGLCQRKIASPSLGGLLQASPDRIDSSRPDYSEVNLQITHLACNLAKNKFTIDDFEKWLEMVSGPIQLNSVIG